LLFITNFQKKCQNFRASALFFYCAPSFPTDIRFPALPATGENPAGRLAWASPPGVTVIYIRAIERIFDDPGRLARKMHNTCRRGNLHDIRPHEGASGGYMSSDHRQRLREFYDQALMSPELLCMCCSNTAWNTAACRCSPEKQEDCALFVSHMIRRLGNRTVKPARPEQPPAATRP
jgi:hypothetical protein